MQIKWNKQQVFNKLAEYLKDKKEDEVFNLLISKKITKEMRSLAQNRTFYKLFTDIWNHLWETSEDVKIYLLSAIFWTKTLTLWKTSIEVPLESHTSKLTKEQWKIFIDTILKFCEAKDLPITITSRELESLYLSYK